MVLLPKVGRRSNFLDAISLVIISLIFLFSDSFKPNFSGYFQNVSGSLRTESRLEISVSFLVQQRLPTHIKSKRISGTNQRQPLNWLVTHYINELATKLILPNMF